MQCAFRVQGVRQFVQLHEMQRDQMGPSDAWKNERFAPIHHLCEISFKFCKKITDMNEPNLQALGDYSMRVCLYYPAA